MPLPPLSETFIKSKCDTSWFHSLGSVSCLFHVPLYNFLLSFSLSPSDPVRRVLATNCSLSLTVHAHSCLSPLGFHYSPDDVEDGRYEELIVDGHRHVTGFVESRGHGADSVAEVHAPQQEQELRWETNRTNNNKKTEMVRGNM